MQPFEQFWISTNRNRRFVYTFCMSKIYCFDSLITTIVQTVENWCIYELLIIERAQRLTMSGDPEVHTYGKRTAGLSGC